MKKVIILAGVSGAGKTTCARREYPGALILSADDTFVGADGVYRFYPRALPAAHARCLRAFVQAVKDRQPETIVVDNTNTTAAEVAPYAALARVYGYAVHVLILHVDPAVAHARNQHGVGLHTIEAQAERLASLRTSLPLRWPVREINEPA